MEELKESNAAQHQSFTSTHHVTDDDDGDVGDDGHDHGDGDGNNDDEDR